MAKIFGAPSSLKVPSFSFTGNIQETRKAYQEAEQTYLDELKALLLKRKNHQYVGEVIKFPVADSYALYMVASLSPVELVELPLGDGWSFQYAHRLTKKDIIEKIESAKKLKEIFSKKS